MSKPDLVYEFPISSLVGLFGKREYLVSKLHYVRFADENEGGSVVDIFGKRKHLASCTTYGSLTKTRERT